MKELETKLVPLNNVNKIELINRIRKLALLTEQFEKLVIKNKFGYDIYDIIESLFLLKHNEKVFKNQCLLYKQFRTKNNRIKIGYMAYQC